MQEIEPVTLRHLSYEKPLQNRQFSWGSFLDGPLRAHAREVALFVADRMRDPAYVKEMAEVTNQQSPYPSDWSPTSLGSGDVGLALMYSYLDACFPGQGWDTVTQQYLSIAAAGTRQSTLLFPSLFSGTTGIALALSASSQGGKRYQRTLTGVARGAVRTGMCTVLAALRDGRRGGVQ